MQYYVTMQYSMQVKQWYVCVWGWGCVCDIKTTINKLGTVYGEILPAGIWSIQLMVIG